MPANAHQRNMNNQASDAGQAQDSEPMIALRDVRLMFGERTILDGINLTVESGETVAIVGPSGSGKSTLIRIIAGLMIPDEGDVKLKSEKIGMAFQYGALFTSKTVANNIRIVLERIGDLDDAEINHRIEEYLTLVGLKNEGDKLPEALSGGMQKRVGIARALAIHPDIMLYDEPSAGLDPILANKLEQELADINRERNMATIVVTHEMDTIERLAARVILLYKGKFVYDGGKDDFMQTDDPFAKQFRTSSIKGPIQL